MTQQSRINLVAGWLLAPLPLFLPLLWLSHARFLGGSDQLFYAHYYAFVSEALKSGDFFPRWFAGANGGFGSAVPLFYPALASTLTALINLPLAPLHLGLGLQMVIGVYASQVVSGYTAWLWLKTRFDKETAISGSQLFVLLPFKLIYIYLNLNLAQLWALAVLPLWMLAVDEMLKATRRSIAFYALALATVYYLHPLTVIAFGAVPAIYVLWFGRKNLGGNALRLALAHLLAAGICLAQAAPQFAYQDWVNIGQFTAGNFNWKNNFFHVDVFLCAYYGIIALLIGYAVYTPPTLKKWVRESRFWIAVIAAVAFMTQSPSAFIWEQVTLLQYLQFPAVRFHAAALMAVTFLICIWLVHEKELLPLGALAYSRFTLLLLVAVFGAATVVRINNVYTGGGTWDVAVARSLRLLPTPEYTTRWGCRDFFEELKDHYRNAKLPEAKTDEGKAALSVVDWNPPEHIALTATVKSPHAVIALRQCYIPKWKASVDGAPFFLRPDSAGLIGLALPKGTHRIEITQMPTRMERISAEESMLALLLCALLLLPDRRRAA